MCRSPASSGAAPDAERRRVERRTRRAAGDRDRQPAQRRAHRAGRRVGETARRTVDRHRTRRGDRTRRAGRPGAGRAVGTRAHHHRRAAALRCRLVDHDGSRARRCSRWPACSATTGRRTRTRTAAREVPGVPVVAVGAQRSSRGAARNRLRPGAHRTRRDRQPAPDRDGSAAAGRRLCAGAG